MSASRAEKAFALSHEIAYFPGGSITFVFAPYPRQRKNLPETQEIQLQNYGA